MNAITIIVATMTSREIAELTGKRHDQVLRTARDLADQGITQSVECLYRSVDGGREYPEHVLSKRDSLVLVARLSPEFTGRVVDRWMELEARPAAPAALSRMELIQLAMKAELENMALMAKIASDAPKIAFAESVRDLDGVCSVEKIAKTLGYGRNKFFKLLKDSAILMSNNLPYQRYLDKAYFTVVEQAPFVDSKGASHPTFTSMVTGRGQVWLHHRYGGMKEA
jgi:phage antirepressor YoqD-like protein